MEKAKKKSKAFLAKEKTVTEIENNIREAKSILFIDYRGINVFEVTALRFKCRKVNVKYKVYKNNLMRIALNNCGITALDNQLVGTTAVAFSTKDETAAAKLILESKFEKKMAFKFGLIGQSVLTAAECVELAKMPSKETLVAQILGLLQLSAKNIATVINAVPRNLAVVINEHTKQAS